MDLRHPHLSRLFKFLLIGLLLAGVFGVSSAPAKADTGNNWTGSYFSNPSLLGQPTFTRIDPVLIFNWGSYGPGPGIGGQLWSARWNSVQYLNAGTYRFNMVVDDGIRVFIDGQSILDQWHDQTATYNVNVQVVAGFHNITVEYYQGQGTSQLALTWDFIGGIQTQWLSQYFNNPYLQGVPVSTRYEAALNFNWGYGSPDPAIPADYFSARFTATLPFNAGTYRFTLTVKDGIRMFIDNNTVVDQFIQQAAPVAYSIDVPISAGVHNIRIEFFHWTGPAIMQLDYRTAVGPPPYQLTNWYGEYFNNPYLQGVPTFTRDDGSGGINYDWSRTGPGRGIGFTNYSVRFTRTLYFPGRPYSFYLTSDDGARLYIDTTLIVDNWRPQTATQARIPVDLTEGLHTIRLEYFQNYYDAVIGLTWDPPNGQNPPLYYQNMVTRTYQNPPPAPGNLFATVTAYKLYLRRGPAIYFPDIGGLNRGEVYQIVGRNRDNSWLQLNVNGLIGWSSSAYLNINGSLINVPVTG